MINSKRQKCFLSFCILALLNFTACNAQNNEVTDVKESASDNTEQTSILPTANDNDETIQNTISRKDKFKQIDDVTYDGVPIKSTGRFSEEQKSEILEAYEALKVLMNNVNYNYPDGSKYLTSIEDVRYCHDLYTHYDPDLYDFSPEKEIEFYVICEDNEILSSTRKNEWYLVSKIDGKWTTYSEYEATHK